MKLKFILPALALSALPANAAITIQSTADASGSQAYATTYFTGVSVSVGDILVVVHAPNKRTTTNTISAAFSAGSNSFSSVNSGDSGGQAAGWVFYSTITNAGTFDISLDTSNATKSVSHATTYFVLRSNVSGGTLSMLDTDGAAGSALTTLSLSNLTWSGSYNDYIALVGASIQTNTITSPGGDWVEQLDRGPNKRIVFKDEGSISSPLSSFTITSGTADNLAAAGIVIGETIPEPTAALLGSLGLLGLLRRRR